MEGKRAVTPALAETELMDTIRIVPKLRHEANETEQTAPLSLCCLKRAPRREQCRSVSPGVAELAQRRFAWEGLKPPITKKIERERSLERRESCVAGGDWAIEERVEAVLAVGTGSKPSQAEENTDPAALKVSHFLHKKLSNGVRSSTERGDCRGTSSAQARAAAGKEQCSPLSMNNVKTLHYLYF